MVHLDVTKRGIPIRRKGGICPTCAAKQLVAAEFSAQEREEILVKIIKAWARSRKACAWCEGEGK